MKAQKPILHARDHMPGGADPIPGLGAAFYGDAVLAIPELWAYWPMNDASDPWQELVAGRVLTPLEKPPDYTFGFTQPGPFNWQEPENCAMFSGWDTAIVPDYGTNAEYFFAGSESDIFEGTHPFSILAWFYPPPPFDPALHPELHADHGSVIAATQGWQLEILPPDDVESALDVGNAGIMQFSSGAFVLEVDPGAEPYLAAWPYHSGWNFVVITYDGETITMYADGILAAAAALASVSTSVSIFSLGRQPLEGSIGVPHYFNGDMAHVALVAMAMTPEQILQLSAQMRDAPGAPVDTRGIANGSVSTPKLADGAVTAVKVADGAIGPTKLADDAVTSAKIATDAVGSSEIAAGAVGSSELASTTVITGSYGDATHVAQFTVDADGRLTAAATVAISSGAPSGPAGGALDGTYPNPGLAAAVAGAGLAETSDVLSVNVDASTIEIASDTLRVKDDGITAAKIAADAVGSSEIAAGAVGASELADTAVTPGSYGDATHVATFTVDQDGRLTAAGSATITASGGTGQHILLADGRANPFAFTDMLQMDDGTDFMWSDP